jgi:hypothetical protein
MILIIERRKGGKENIKYVSYHTYLVKGKKGGGEICLSLSMLYVFIESFVLLCVGQIASMLQYRNQRDNQTCKAMDKLDIYYYSIYV